MNYSKRGIQKRKQNIRSFGKKMGKKFTLYLVRFLLIAIIATAVFGACAGVGVFKGIIDTSPEITNIDVSLSSSKKL